MDELTDQYGHDDSLFISETQDYLHCGICTLVLRDPVMIISCGHKFCSVCFNRIKDFSVTNNSDLRCPIDRGVIDINKVHQDIALRRVVGSLLVRCRDHELGCQWTGELSDVNIHHEQCPYKPVNSGNASLLIVQVKELKDRLDRFELSLFEKEKENVLLKHEQLQLKEEMQITRQQQEQQKQQQQQKMNAVIQKNEVLEQKMLQLEKDKETQRKLLGELSKEREQQQKKNEVLEQKILQLVKDKEAQGKVLGELSKEREEQQKTNVDLKQNILQLRKDKETQEKLLGKLSKEFEQSEKKNENLDQKVLHQEKSVEMQGKQLVEQAKHQEQQQRTINQLLSKVETLQAELASYRTGVKFEDLAVAATNDSVRKKGIPFQHRIGDPASIIISKDQQHIEFLGKWATVSAPTGVVPPKAKAWYEVEWTRRSGGSIVIGWATTDLPTSTEYLTEYVGNRSHSYGFESFHGNKHHNGSTQWGTQCTGEKYVVGVALDLLRGEVLFSVDGKWSLPMGVAFTGISTDIKLFPAVSGTDSSIHLNVGDRAFKYGPPDSSYESLIDALSH